jgi:hypothetical protein
VFKKVAFGLGVGKSQTIPMVVRNRNNPITEDFKLSLFQNGHSGHVLTISCKGDWCQSQYGDSVKTKPNPIQVLF